MSAIISGYAPTGGSYCTGFSAAPTGGSKLIVTAAKAKAATRASANNFFFINFTSLQARIIKTD